MNDDVGGADTIASDRSSGPLSKTIADDHTRDNRDSQPAIDRGQLIGRFVVLEELGTGGMGVVYAAYDPNLDRKVAIKLLRAQAMGSAEARTRLLREAQAMARIDHPNVLRVHEAGTVGDRVFIAMEFAGGGTLRDWLKETRTTNDIMAAFAQAGAGLAAAHAAGLVHRDFKPDNVLLLGDGQARVTDFGLVGVVGEQPAARPSGDLDKPLTQNTPLSRDLTRTGALMGTPAYMSPEQFKGGLVGPAADQFAFSVALYESLYKQRPFLGATFTELCASVIAGAVQTPPRDSDVPARVRRAVLRGLATEPGRRHASMDKLIAELVGDDGGRKRVVWIAAGAAVAVALGTVGVLATLGGGDVCGGADTRVAKVWGATQKQTLSAAFAATNRPDSRAVLERALPIVDGWHHSWQQAYVAACEDTRVHKVQSEHVLDLRMDCLVRDLDEAHATLDALATGGGDAVDHALGIVRGLPSIAACADTAALASGIAPPPPETAAAVAAVRGKIDQARAQHKLAHYAPAMTIARAALDDARATKYEPVIAQALLEFGRLQAGVADPKALDTLAEAMMTATTAGDTETATRAASRRLVLMASKPAKFPVADEINKIATALAAHASLTPATRVDLDDAAGMLLQEEHKGDAAQARYEHALQIATTQLGSDAPDTLVTLQSLGTLAAERHKFADATKLFQQVLSAQERVAGKDHPDYALALENFANVLSETGKVAETKQLREQALAIRIAALGPDHPDVATSYDHIAGYYVETGDYANAKAYFEQSLAIDRKVHGEDSVEQTTTMLNLGLALTDMGDLDGARSVLEKARALLEKAYGAEDQRVAPVLANLGIVAQRQRRYDDAIALFKTTQKINETVFGPNDTNVIDALGNLASVYMDAGKLTEAQEQMKRLMALVTELEGAGSVHMGLTLGNYGFLQIKLGDPKGALESFQKSHDILEAKLGKNHPNVAFAAMGLGQALVLLQRPAEAIPHLERALEIGNAAHIDPDQLAEMHYHYAEALAASPATRAKAHAEATTALAMYDQAHDVSPDAEKARRWLKAH